MSDIFETYLKSQETKNSYRYVWNIFLEYLKTSEEKILSLERKEQEEKIVKYVNFLKEQKRAPTTIKLRLSVLQFAFSMNDVILNWKKLKRMTPERVKPSGMDTWSDSEIREMIKVAGTVRNRTMIYFFASVGCRITAFTELKIKDIEDFEDCICVMIYSGFPEEYPSFLTPEATKMLKYYLKIRKDRGEKLEPESPLFASEAVVNKIDVTKQMPRPLSKQAATHAFNRIFKKFPNSRTKTGFRYNIQVTHGFRKWQATKLKLKIDVHHSISERLLGHKAGLDSNYFVTNSREAKLQLFEAFKKCIPDLTIDKTETIQKAEQYRHELDKLKTKYDDLLKSFKMIANGIEENHLFDANSVD